MDDKPDNSKERVAELDQQVASLKEYLASHPQHPATPPSTDGRADSCWNAISLISPFAGIVLAFFAAFESSRHSGDSWGFRGLACFVFTFVGCTFIGFIAALVACRRNERRPGLTSAGLFLNGIPTVGFILLLLAR